MYLEYTQKCRIVPDIATIMKKYVFTHPGDEINQFMKDKMPTNRCEETAILKTEAFVSFQKMIDEHKVRYGVDKLRQESEALITKRDTEPLAYISYVDGYTDALNSFAQDVCIFMGKAELVIMDGYIGVTTENLGIEFYRASARANTGKDIQAFYLPQSLVAESIKQGGAHEFCIHSDRSKGFADDVMMKNSGHTYKIKQNIAKLPEVLEILSEPHQVSPRFYASDLDCRNNVCYHIDETDESKHIKVRKGVEYVFEYIFSNLTHEALAMMDYASKEIIITDKRWSLAGDEYMLVLRVKGE